MTDSTLSTVPASASPLERSASQGDTFQRALAILKRWDAACGCTYAGSLDSWEPCHEHDLALALATFASVQDDRANGDVTALPEPRSQSGRVATFKISEDVAQAVREGAAEWPVYTNIQGTEAVALKFPRLWELLLHGVKQEESRRTVTTRGHSGRADATRQRTHRASVAASTASAPVASDVTNALSRAR